MNPIDQPEELKAYYRSDAVASQYLPRRTAEPFNGYLHASQVAFLNRTLRKRLPRRVLEIAPGPARLTAELDTPASLVAIDASARMLALARERLGANARSCSLLQGDAFRLPFADGSFEFVFALKLIRHFRIRDRRRLYGEIHRVLAPGGGFVLDAQNRAVSLPHRIRKGLPSYRVYDALYDSAELVAELEDAGLRVLWIEGIARHFELQRRVNLLRRMGLRAAARLLIALIDRLPGGAPSTWMVLSEVRS
jgi:ubiquinone/menaquinone biosynthesis C-methylase UbiE